MSGILGPEESRPVAAQAGDEVLLRQSPLAQAFVPLLFDLAVPVGGFYALRDALGLSLISSLAISSIGPGLRTVAATVRHGAFNGLAGLMLAVNFVGIALSFVTGDPRLMIAKDSGISSVIGITVLISALRGRPMMSAALKPVLTQGRSDRVAAWNRQTASDPRFQRYERLYSGVWGAVLLAECLVRIIGAYTLPVTTMVWLGTVILLGAIFLAVVLSGVLAARHLQAMVQQVGPA